MTSNRPDGLDDIRRKHRALAILRMLLNSSSYTSNDQVLGDWLQEIGLSCSNDDLRDQISALVNLGLLASRFSERIVVIELTNRGEEVAEGKTFVEEVMRPSPECPY